MAPGYEDLFGGSEAQALSTSPQTAAAKTLGKNAAGSKTAEPAKSEKEKERMLLRPLQASFPILKSGMRSRMLPLESKPYSSETKGLPPQASPQNSSQDQVQPLTAADFKNLAMAPAEAATVFATQSASVASIVAAATAVVSASSGARRKLGTKQKRKTEYSDEYDPSQPNDYEAYKKWRREIHSVKLKSESSKDEQVLKDTLKSNTSEPSKIPNPEALDKSDHTTGDMKDDSDVAAAAGSGWADDSDVDFDYNYDYEIEGESLSAVAGSEGPTLLDRVIDGVCMSPFDSSRLPDFLKLYVLDNDSKVLSQLRQRVSAKIDKITQKSRVVVLCNMIDPEDVDDDLREEVCEECQQYGEISSSKIHVNSNLPTSEAVRIFIEFSNIKSADRALTGLNGRFFAGRTTSAYRYSEELYQKKNLWSEFLV